MSATTNPPVPNNLTQVRFGPVSVDFTKAGATVIGQLEYDENVFVPTNAFIVYTNAAGTNGTAAVVALNNGTTGNNIATATLPATPVVAINGTGSLSQTALAPVTNGFVLGQVPVGTNGSNGAASVQSLTLNVTTAAVPALATTNRVTANNISTLTVSSVPSWITAGAVVNVLSVGNAAYNGTVTVISKTSTTFSYYNPSLTTEASTADTAGRIGALTGDVYVVGLLQ
jgi:hypothetical protein